ncbi:unnamed protein product [Arabidopsis halleri]
MPYCLGFFKRNLAVSFLFESLTHVDFDFYVLLFDDTSFKLMDSKC